MRLILRPAEQKTDLTYFLYLLRLGSMKEDEKNSREQPKDELWIHGRAYLTAMDMPQSKANENRYFCRIERLREW
jgi:hypothetical protein